MAIVPCLDQAHVFTPLYPSWQPDAASMCDCGAVSYSEHLEQKRERLRQEIAARLEGERHKKRDIEPPGNNPAICAHCWGRMSTAIHGQRTKLWIRTCTSCYRQTGTPEAPRDLSTHAVAGVAGPMFSPIETIHRPTPEPTQPSLLTAPKRRRR